MVAPHGSFAFRRGMVCCSLVPARWAYSGTEVQTLRGINTFEEEDAGTQRMCGVSAHPTLHFSHGQQHLPPASRHIKTDANAPSVDLSPDGTRSPKTKHESDTTFAASFFVGFIFQRVPIFIALAHVFDLYHRQ